MKNFVVPFIFLLASCQSSNTGRKTVEPKSYDIGDGQIVNSVDISEDGQLIIAGGENKRIKILKSATGEPTWISDTQPDAVLCVGFSPDNKYFFATGSDNTKNTGQIVLYELATHAERWGVKGITNDVQWAKFSPDGKQILVANHYHLTLYDVETGKQIKFLSGHPIEVTSPYGHYDAVSDAVWTKDPNVFVSVGWDKKALVWDIAQGHDTRTYSQADAINACIMSEDDRRIITGSADALHIWNRDNNKPEAIFSYDGEIKEIAMADSGRYFISGDDEGDLTLWNSKDYSKLKEIKKAHQRGIWGLSVKNHWVVTSGGDGKITLWDWNWLKAYQSTDSSGTPRY